MFGTLSLGLGLGARRSGSGAAPAAPAELPVTPTARWHPQFSSVVTSSGRVTSATDLMGLADVTEGASGAGPLALTDATGRPFWRFNGTEYLNVASTLTGGNNRDVAVFFVGRLMHFTTSTNTIFSQGNAAAGTQVNTGGGQLSTSLTADAPWLRSHGTIGTVATTNRNHMMAGTEFQVVSVCSRTTANGGIRIMSNNNASNDMAQASINVTSIVGAEIGRFANSPGSSGTWGTFDLYELVIYYGAPTNAQQDAIQAALVSHYNISAKTNRIVLDGDSITQGTGTVTAFLAPAALLTEPGEGRIPATWSVVRVGRSGNAIANLITRRDLSPSWADQTLSGENVVAVENGRNDFPTADAPTYYAAFLPYLTDTTTGLLDRGWNVRVMANIATGNATAQARIEAFRALIRDAQFLTDTDSGTGGTHEGAVTIIDTDLIEDSAVQIFFDAGDSGSATYYQGDNTHPTPLGALLRVTGGDDPERGFAFGLAA